MKNNYYELTNIGIDKDNVENIIMDINHVVMPLEVMNFMNGNNISHVEVIQYKYRFKFNIYIVFTLFKIMILYPFKLTYKRYKEFVFLSYDQMFLS